MKTKTLYALIGVVSILTAARVDAATIFAPTDGDVNFVTSTLSLGTMLAMFDDSDQAFAGTVLAGTALDIPIPEIVGILGPIGGGDFIATNESGGTLTLTGSDQFILGISTDGGTSWSGDTSITALGANSYNVTFSDGSVLQIDVRVIPVPAAVWLFGSGLLGLVGVAKRKARVA